MNRNLILSAKEATLREFAQHLLAECNAARNPDGTVRESIEAELACEHNGSGPGLLVRFGNDDCEGDHIEGGQALWEGDCS